MMKRILSILLLLALFPFPAGATTDVARVKNWTSEKLYAADLNAEFDNLISYNNNNIAFVTNITASAAELNQLDNNRFTAAAKFIATVTDSADHIMLTGWTFTNYGKALFDSAQVDTFYSDANGTRGDNTFFFHPLNDLNTYFGTPTKRVRSFTGDTARVQVLAADSVASGTLILDGTLIRPKTDRTGRVGLPTFMWQALHADSIVAQNVTLDSATVTSGIDSASIDAGGVSRANLRIDAVDSVVIRAASVAGSDMAGTLSGNKEWTGRHSFPRQPSFMVTGSGNILNVTGAGTSYTIAFDTETFDQAGDFTLPSTFTAPVTGRYILGVIVSLGGITTSATRTYLQIITSNKTYNIFLGDTMQDSINGELVLSGSVLADMDALDTATVTLNIAGEGSDVVDLAGTQTQFYGFLAQ